MQIKIYNFLMERNMNNEIINLVQLTDTTFKLFEENNKTYTLSFIQKEKAVEFQIKRQLSPVTYEGIFTLEDFLKIDKIFYLYDMLKDVYQVILGKILNKTFNLSEQDNFLHFILRFEVENKKKNVTLKIPKNPEFDLNKHVEDLSNTVMQLMEEKNVLSNTVMQLVEKEKVMSNTISQLIERIKKIEPFLVWNDSTILKENEFGLIKEWIGGDLELKLLYKSSRDGKSAADFHEKCDNKGPTISFIENGPGRRFGGYTTLNWDSSGNWKSNDPSAFIFSLDNKRKFKINDQNYVIYCHSSYNVTFGGGHDIYINNNFTSGSSSNFPYSYGKDEKFENKPEWYLTGEKQFSVKEVEVYSVLKK